MERKDNDSRAPGICRRLFNFFMSYFAFQLIKRVTLGGTNYNVEASGGAGRQMGRPNKPAVKIQLAEPSMRGGKAKEVSQDGLLMVPPSDTINLEIQGRNDVANGLIAYVEDSGPEEATRGRSFSPGEEKSSRQIVIERGKWRVEGVAPSSATVAKRERGLKKSVSMKEDRGKGKAGERRAVRRGVPRREVLDINERSEHFIQQRRAAMWDGSDVGRRFF